MGWSLPSYWFGDFVHHFDLDCRTAVATLVLALAGGFVGLFFDAPAPRRGLRLLQWASIGLAAGAIAGFAIAGWLLADWQSLWAGGDRQKPAFNAEAGVAGACCRGLAGAVAGALLGIVAGFRRTGSG